MPILLPTSPAFVEALLGTMLAGAIPVPLASPMTFGGPERYLRNLVTILDDAGATALITDARMRDAAAADDEVRRRLATVITPADLGGAAPLDPRLPSLGARDTAFLQYTSGTTGRPKGVVVSHGALVANAFAIAHGLAIGPHDVGVSWLPMFHDMGLIGVLLTAICHPYPLHLLPPQAFLMSPTRWLRLVADVGGTLSPAPNFGYELAVAKGRDLAGARLDRWRVALNGSEPVHAATIERFAARYGADGFRPEAMMPVYGMAESTLAVTFPAPGSGASSLAVDRRALEEDAIVKDAHDSAMHAVCVGGPVAGTTIAIAAPDGSTLAERVVGEIRVAGPSLMDGYFRNDEASAAALSGGWLCTGDLGFVDRGRLYVVGRAKELVIKAGRNLHPYDIERIVGAIPGVRAGGAAAFGRPNGATGTDDLVVAVETSESDAGKREAIVRAVRGEVLAVLGVGVDDVRIWAPGRIPRTTSGKIQRRDCARLASEEPGT